MSKSDKRKVPIKDQPMIYLRLISKLDEIEKLQEAGYTLKSISTLYDLTPKQFYKALSRAKIARKSGASFPNSDDHKDHSIHGSDGMSKINVDDHIHSSSSNKSDFKKRFDEVFGNRKNYIKPDPTTN